MRTYTVLKNVYEQKVVDFGRTEAQTKLRLGLSCFWRSVVPAYSAAYETYKSLRALSQAGGFSQSKQIKREDRFGQTYISIGSSWTQGSS
jgi:hypothetical protein